MVNEENKGPDTDISVSGQAPYNMLPKPEDFPDSSVAAKSSIVRYLFQAIMLILFLGPPVLVLGVILFLSMMLLGAKNSSFEWLSIFRWLLFI